MRKCPFNNSQCDDTCGLYIKLDELNETVANRLKSIGVISTNGGICSIKNIALAQSRFIFENTKIFKN